MADSAAALNAFADTVPYNPLSPPVLFGDLALDEFKIAFKIVFEDGVRKWDSRRSRWVDTGGQWRIIPVTVRIPDGEVNVWTTKIVPGPIPLLGIAAAFGYSRRIRSRIKGARLA